MKKVVFMVLCAALFGTGLLAQEAGHGKFSGLMFGDYYYVADNHNTNIKDHHGYWFRRIYFTYDYTIDNNFSTRFRLEMGNDGSYSSEIVMAPFVKDAYLKYKISDQSFILGISPTPTFALVEKFWGYRSVEKTPLDLQRISSSRDFGLAAMGSFDSQKQFRYHAMFSNGSSNKQEVNKGKSGMLALSYYPVKNFVIELYGDYADLPGIDNTYLLQAFAGYKSDELSAGVLYADQTLENSTTGNTKRRVISGFFTHGLSNKINLLLRADIMLDPNLSGEKIAYIPFDKTAKSNLFIAGIDWTIAEDVHLIPNLKFVKYSENDLGITPGNDIYANLTFYWQFK